MHEEKIEKCKNKLIEVARARDLITYGDLAAHVGVANQGIGTYLKSIYNEETRRLEHPDLTLVAVSAKTRFGRFNSKGRPAQSVTVDPDNPHDVRKYEEQLAKVCEHWSR